MPNEGQNYLSDRQVQRVKDAVEKVERIKTRFPSRSYSPQAGKPTYVVLTESVINDFDSPDVDREYKALELAQPSGRSTPYIFDNVPLWLNYQGTSIKINYQGNVYETSESIDSFDDLAGDSKLQEFLKKVVNAESIVINGTYGSRIFFEAYDSDESEISLHNSLYAVNSGVEYQFTGYPLGIFKTPGFLSENEFTVKVEFGLLYNVIQAGTICRIVDTVDRGWVIDKCEPRSARLL